jgi:hypothetical protein
MSGFRLRCALAASAAVLAACASDSLLRPEPLLSSAARSDKSADSSDPYQVDVASLSLKPGNTYQLVVTKSANGKAVPNPSIAFASSDATVASVTSDGFVTAIAPGATTIAVTRGSHEVDVAVTVIDPCAPLPIETGVTTGEITPDDCPFASFNRREDWYSFTPANGEVLKIKLTGVAGLTGVTNVPTDALAATVLGSANTNVAFRVIGNGDALREFVADQDGTIFGAYSLTRTIDTTPFSCGTNTFIIAGATFSAAMATQTSCVGKVAFTNVPQALGKPLNLDRYVVRVTELKPYTITISGLTSSFDPALTVYPNVLNAPPIAQALPSAAPAPASRSVTFTPPSLGYYLIEVAGGRFIDNLVTWSAQTGPYTVSVSR